MVKNTLGGFLAGTLLSVFMLFTPQRTSAGTLVVGGYALSKEGVDIDSVIGIDTETGEKRRGKVDSEKKYAVAFINHLDNDLVLLKGITTAKETVAVISDVGPTNSSRIKPTMIANAKSMCTRDIISSTVESTYAKVTNIGGGHDTTYFKLLTKTSQGPFFQSAADITPFLQGDSLEITIGLRDSSGVSLGKKEGYFIDADTATSPVTLTYAPRFRDVSITGISQLPDTVTVDSVYPRFMRVKNNSDLRDEKVLCTLTRTRNGETLETRIDSVNLGAPHFSNDSAEISFPDWTVSQSDTGLNVLTYTANPGVDSLIKTEVESVYAKLNDTTGIQEAKLQKYMKQRASLVTGAEFVSKYGKNYDVFDAVGRRIDILNVRENGHGNRNRNSGGHLKMYFVKEKNVLDEVRKVLVVD